MASQFKHRKSQKAFAERKKMELSNIEALLYNHLYNCKFNCHIESVSTDQKQKYSLPIQQQIQQDYYLNMEDYKCENRC